MRRQTLIDTNVDVDGVYRACCADCDWCYSDESERVVSAVAKTHEDIRNGLIDDHDTGLYWTTNV